MSNKLYLAACACICVFVSCNKENLPIVQEEKIAVSLSMVSADIIMEDEPITRAGEETTTFAILAFEYNANTSNYEAYARGVFNSSNNISILLTKNKKYLFQVALFKDFFSSGEQLNAYYNSDTTYYSANNKFVYDNMIFRQMHGGYSDAFRNSKGTHPAFMGDTFYGKTEYTATGSGKVDINLSRVSTYLEIVVNGMTEGKVSSTDMGIDFDIAYPDNTFSTWLTDSHYMEGSSFIQTLLLQYFDANNNATKLVHQNFTFKRNYKKSITINLKSSSQNTLSNTLSLQVSDTALQNDISESFDCTI